METTAQRISASPSISIIIPTRNEAGNIAPLVSRISAVAPPFHEIIFVDADSNDGTLDIIRSLAASHPIRLVKQNEAVPGLAPAIVEGANAATGELLIVMDADLSHPPEKIEAILSPVITGAADLVIGSRYIPGGSTPGWPFWRRMLSRIASAAAYPLTGVHDSLSGFFGISRAQFLKLAKPAIGFKIVFEMILRGRPTLRVLETPIAFRDRLGGRSKMSLGIASLFFLRWCVAVVRRLLGS